MTRLVDKEGYQLQIKPTVKLDQYRVLFVDDDDVIRDSVIRYLEYYHEADYALTIDAASSLKEAIQLLDENQYELVISDINLPEDDGFKFLEYVKINYPNTKRVLITAYKVLDYIRMAKQYGIFNIIAKTAPFNFDELSNVINSILIPESCFHLSTYMMPGTNLQECIITNSDEIETVFSQVKAFLEENKVQELDNYATALMEALTNAVYHSAKLPDGSLKYRKNQPIEKLEDHEYVLVYYGRDQERVGVSIVDQSGNITAEEVLYWLDRNISGAGLLDTHGRGMYLMLQLVDRLIINIAPKNFTEIIILDYFNDRYNSNKPLYINQVL